MMGAMAQGICEKYMKHIITEYDPVETSQEEAQHNKVLKTRSLDIWALIWPVVWYRVIKNG